MAIQVLLKTLLGLVLCFLSIFLGYLFLDGLQNGGSPLFLFAAIVLMGVGVFCLVKAGKSDATVMMKIKSEPMVQKEGQTLLDKNNALLGDWKKTADARDRLKVLEAAQNENVI